MRERQTIVAIATAPGRGGIGVVRLSGEHAVAIATPLLQLRGGELEPGRARFAYVLDRLLDEGIGAVLDEAVVTWFAAPRSYTGEDVVEISLHGAPVLLNYMVRACIERGARLAEPGEFTRRAFLSGRLDLTQAEAVADLIGSTTLHQARVAASQMGGALSRAVAPIKAGLVRLIATLEAGIDFAEDDLEVLPLSGVLAQIDAVAGPLVQLERTFRYGQALREGFTLAIVGRPNAGKSSLFNALLERDRAIVTAVPGTTRDVISERMSFAGVPVEIADTAGIREAADEIEALGIARSHETLADAALVLLVVDGTQPLHADDLALAEAARARPLLLVINKTDLAEAETLAGLEQGLAGAGETLRVSARTGAGLTMLRERIGRSLVGEGSAGDSVMLTNLRQHGAVVEALAALAEARAAASSGIPHEMVLLDLHTALDALDQLTGTTTTDDVLELIFSTFCIGK